MKPSEVIAAIEKIFDSGWISCDGDDLGESIRYELILKMTYPDIDVYCLLDIYGNHIDDVLPSEISVRHIWEAYIDEKFTKADSNFPGGTDE